MVKKGVFIVIEGLDGSGKTTQATLLAEKLRKNYQVHLTAEPSRGKIGTFIRESYLFQSRFLSREAEALLFATDRMEHMQNELLPALEAGKLVICDRYTYSSLAYQGSAGLSLDWIKTINARAIQPDFSVYLDVLPAIALQRPRRSKSVMETLETQQKAREVYLKLVQNGELTLIDGANEKDFVADDLFIKVESSLEVAETFL